MVSQESVHVCTTTILRTGLRRRFKLIYTAHHGYLQHPAKSPLLEFPLESIFASTKHDLP